MAETPADLVAKIQRRIDEHGQYLSTLHRDRDVDGYLAACRSFDTEMAGYARALMKLCGDFQAGLVEACDIADTAIRMRGDFLGHQNKMGSDRIAELRKIGA